MNNRREFVRGLRFGVPVLIGFLPIAITFSMLALQEGLRSGEAILMSVCVLAGASQMAAVTMLGTGAGITAIVFAVFLLNLRHLVMSTYVMNRLEKIPVCMKLILAFGVTDETFAIMSSQEEDKGNGSFLAGLILLTYTSWIGGTVLGVILNAIIPKVICDSMSIALYVMFIGILISEIRKEKAGLIIAGISMLINYTLSKVISPSWSLIIAIMAGSIAGTFILEGKGKKDEAGNNKDNPMHVIGNLFTKGASGNNH